MRDMLFVLGLLVGSALPASAQVSVRIAVPGLSIGIDLPVQPRLVRVPDQPVYYAPGVASNYFFYDGSYWIYQQDNWYESTWYNGPWRYVDAQAVPSYVLRVPVRYYRSPPSYFRGWRTDAAPRWGEHWGNDWQRHRPDWDRRDRRPPPVPAPLPFYQRKYPNSRYPQPEQQQPIHRDAYRYQPREAPAHPAAQAPKPRGRSEEHRQDTRRVAPGGVGAF